MGIYDLARQMVAEGYFGQGMDHEEKAKMYIIMAADNPKVEEELPPSGFNFWGACEFRYKVWKTRKRFGQPDHKMSGEQREWREEWNDARAAIRALRSKMHLPRDDRERGAVADPRPHGHTVPLTCYATSALGFFLDRGRLHLTALSRSAHDVALAAEEHRRWRTWKVCMSTK